MPTPCTPIPRPGGVQGVLGFASLEGEIGQRAVVEILNAAYESDFSVPYINFGPAAGGTMHLMRFRAGSEGGSRTGHSTQTSALTSPASITTGC